MSEEKALQRLLVTTHVLGQAHVEVRDRASFRYYALGTFVAIFTALTSALTFFGMGEFGALKFWVDIGLGTIGIVAAIGATLQTFMDYGGRARAHDTAAKQFNALYRRVERASESPSAQQFTQRYAIDEELEKVIKESPFVSKSLQLRTLRRLYPEEKEMPEKVTGGGGVFHFVPQDVDRG